jgi:hypothetical protein
MKKNAVQNVIIHNSDNINSNTLADKVADFHYSIIEQRLNSSNLTTEEKILVINKILKNLKVSSN